MSADGARPPLPAGTLTFVFTDIEGSTQLVQAIGEARFAAVLEDHGRLVGGAFDAAGGHRVRMEGDSFFYVFPRATSAVAAVVAAQRALAAHTFPEQVAIRVRMGLHTGEASLGSEATGADYVGYDVHRAARIANAGHGGQVLLSEPAHLLVRDALPAGVTVRDLGEHRFKDLGRAERVLQLIIGGLPADFPPIRSLNAVPNNLPTQVTSFVGRDREKAEGVRLFANTRVLTLTGPGGTGKTRLSLQIAAQVAHEFPGGVTFVPLAPIVDPELVAPAIVDALHLETAQSPPRDRLVQHLRDRRALLVLDNFEQVLAAATLVADLIRACPELKVIASSRGPLRISGEQEMPVPPLALPDPGAPPERMSQYEAVRLFIERAVAVKPGFKVTNENAPAVAEICARLDGLPLAIELAAARVRLLPPAAILTRLASRLGLLQSGARDLPDRQKTLRGAIAWSHDLLDEPGRRLFARLAVFAGGGELEDVEAICCSDDLGVDVLAGLDALVDQSLVRQEQHDAGARAIMLETIREFALERLDASPDVEAIRGRHAARFLALAEEAEPHILRVERRAWLGRLEREHDNLRAAFDFCAGTGRIAEALRLVAASWRFWHIRGHLHEGMQRVRRVLDDPASRAHPAERERALEAAGGLSYWLADMETTIPSYDEALALARAMGDKSRISNALYNLSFIPVWAQVDRSIEDRTATAEAQIREALALAREVGDRGAIARCLWAQANTITYLRKDSAASLIPLREAIPIFRELGDHFGLAWALHTEGLARLKTGDSAAARAAFDEQVTLLGEARDPSGLAIALGNQAQLAYAEGDSLRAIRLQGASAALRHLTGAELVSRVDAIEGRSIEPTPENQDAFKDGLAMTFDQAVAYALRRVAIA
jgi:predicted ATPase/class 3 adenylate cyclase